MHDEAGVDAHLVALGGAHLVGVRVTAEPVLRLEQHDTVGVAKQVGSGETGDPGPHHRHGGSGRRHATSLRHGARR